MLKLRPNRFWLYISAACIVPAVLGAFQTYMQGKLSDDRGVDWAQVIFEGSEWLFLGALTPITYFLARRFPLRRETIGRTFLIHMTGALVLCVGWATAGELARHVLRMGQLGLLRWSLISLPYSVFMYFAVAGCVYAFTYFLEAREREAQGARLSAQLSDARLGALQMQLHPHFLFNSLNAIAVLVRDERTRDASRMLELLGDILRQVLRGDRAHEIPLADEIHFLEQYLEIERVRFSDRLTVVWDVQDDARDALIPSFVAQPLVENALRHGVAKRSDAAEVRISARRDGDVLVLTVADTGPGLNGEAAPQEGVGLTNTRERLRTLYGDAARLDLANAPGGGTEATIRLPFRRAGHG